MKSRTRSLLAFKLVLFLLTLAALCARPALASTEVGKELYKEGKYSAALDVFKVMDEAGDPEAQYYLGIMYEAGNGVPKNETEAAAWYMKAAKNDHVQAQLKMSEIYRTGHGVEKDEAISAYWQWRASSSFETSEKKRLETQIRIEAKKQPIELLKKHGFRCEKDGVPCDCRPPEYPSEALRLRQEGSVELIFLLDPTGKVIEVTIGAGSGSEILNEAARQSFSQCYFRPRIVDGKPVMGIAAIRYVFKLD